MPTSEGEDLRVEERRRPWQLALRSGLEQRAEQVSVMLIDRGPSVPSASFVAL
jgi:hypothetical protein